MTLSNPDYGVFANVVAVSGTIIAAGSAIGLGWRRRAKWEPIEQDVPAGPQKVGSLISAVIIALIFVTWNGPEFQGALSKTAIWCLAGTVVSLIIYTLLFALVYEKEEVVPDSSPPTTRRVKVIGGLWLTKPAKEKLGTDGANTVQDLYEGALYRKDLLWPKIAQQISQSLFILAYLGLICAGTIALASASILTSLKMKT